MRIVCRVFFWFGQRDMRDQTYLTSFLQPIPWIDMQTWCEDDVEDTMVNGCTDMKPTQTWWAAESVSFKRHAWRTGAVRSWRTSILLQGCCGGKKGRFVQRQIVLHSSRSHMKASEWLSFNRHLHSVNTAEGGGTSAHWLNTGAESVLYCLLFFFLLCPLVTHEQTWIWTSVVVGRIAFLCDARGCIAFLVFAPSSAAYIPLYPGWLIQHEPTCKVQQRRHRMKWLFIRLYEILILFLIKLLAY